MIDFTRDEIKNLIKEQFLLVEQGGLLKKTEPAIKINTTSGGKGGLKNWPVKSKGEGGGGKKKEDDGETPDTNDGDNIGQNTTGVPEKDGQVATEPQEEKDQNKKDKKEAPEAEQDDSNSNAGTAGEGAPSADGAIPSATGDAAAEGDDDSSAKKESEEEDGTIQKVVSRYLTQETDRDLQEFRFVPKKLNGEEQVLVITGDNEKTPDAIIEEKLKQIYSLDGVSADGLTDVWFNFFGKDLQVDESWALHSLNLELLDSDLKKVAYLSWLMSKGILKQKGPGGQTFKEFSKANKKWTVTAKFFNEDLALAKLEIPSSQVLASKVAQASALAKPKTRKPPGGKNE